MALPVNSHGGRKHSKFSASGAERWLSCPGSVRLSEGIPSKDSVWSREGTKAHEVLEQVLLSAKLSGLTKVNLFRFGKDVPLEMRLHALSAANFVLGLHAGTPGSDLLVETRIALPFIHPEMFGTFDGGVVEVFGRLHVIDYKYGRAYVDPKENLQMIFYALGLAHLYDWNFQDVRVWIIQPRIKGYDGPAFWDLSISDLKKYIEVFRKGVARAEAKRPIYSEGSHCHWCPAQTICPLKLKGKQDAARLAFS